MVVEEPDSCTLQVGAAGDSSGRLSAYVFICGGLGDKLGVSHAVAAGGFKPRSDAEGIGW